MPQISCDEFKELLKSDGFEYVVTSKHSEPITIDFPNLPEHHKSEFDEWRREQLPDSTVIWFEYKGLKYKLLRNMGVPDCNDGTFGAVYDENNVQILNLISSGDMETTIQSLKIDDQQLDEAFSKKIAPYVSCFEILLQTKTVLEYLAFKVLVETGGSYDPSVIDERYGSDDGDNDNNSEDEEN